jgi:N-acetylneuraminic acid mutarotase
VKKYYLFFFGHQLQGFILKSIVSGFIFCFTCAVVLAQQQNALSDFNVINWSSAAPQPFNVSEAQGRVVNGKLYCFGGFDSQKSTFTPTKRAYVFDPVVNTWSAIADLPHTPNGANFGGITHAGIATDGTDLYIAGGYTSDSAGTGQIFGTRQVWKYIIAQNVYTRLPDLPIRIAAGQLEYLNGVLHYIAGTDSSRTKDLGNHYVLNLNNLQAGWDTMAPLPNPRQHAASSVFGGKIYFLGGQHGQDEMLVTQKEVDVFDPANNSWTRLADLPVPAGANGRGHISSAGVVMGSRILLFGGEIVHQTSVNLVSAYTPATNTWANLTHLPQNRYSGVAGIMNGTIYYTGGSETSNTFRGVPDTSLSANALLFVENPDNFPANDRFVFSRVQVPWSRNDTNYNANHDSLAVRIRNKGTQNLIIKKLTLSVDTAWKFVKLNGVDFDSVTSLPLTIAPGAFADLTIRFTAADAATRVKILQDTLTIFSNDSKFPSKTVYLSGLWQKQGEGENEPSLQEIINAFGFKTRTGFNHNDPDQGDTTKLKGDQILSSFFVRADTTRPVQVRQIGSYHGCCTQTETIKWYNKGSDTLRVILTHLAADAQSLLPRKNNSTSSASAAFTPPGAFGFKVGNSDNTDPSKNVNGTTGIRILKAYDVNRKIIPNSYLFSNDYLGSPFTNSDYNDNTYFITNVRPANGAAFFSLLNPSPSDLDFGEKILKTSNSLSLKLSSLGQIYADSTRDPDITIDSVTITGENKSEFTFALPAKRTLIPQDSTALTVTFNPATQGLKIADLLIHYNNSRSPLRVPLYGIAESPDTTVIVNYRISSGSSTPMTINGKTWGADTPYLRDSTAPFTNIHLHQIAGTDEDSLYLKEQSSTRTQKFRYEFPVENGDYVVRLHFAEIYWGAPGSGISGGAGSRIMDVALENVPRLVNFDVTQEVGGATALIKNLPVTVTDGKLNIDFSASVNNPMVVAVEIYSFRASAILASADPAVNILPAGNGLKKPKVYPNPLQKRFTIEFPGEYSGYTNLQISDALGHKYDLGKIKLQRGISNNTEVNISRLSLKPGFYYLKIVSETRPADIIKLIIK